MTAPNFFIIGAPKCGTTALSEYLRSHPQVFMSALKEPSYFCDDLPGLQFIRDKQGYERLFSRATSSQLAVGEASPAYLYSERAVARIREYNADARLIVLLRNPVDMLPSYHSQLVYSEFEDRKDFKEAWDLQAERRLGRHIPKSCREPKLLQYEDVACFADQLERMFEFFPKEQVLVLFFDDLRVDARAVYVRALGFLGLQSDNKTDFPVLNPNKAARFRALNRLLHNPPAWASYIMRNTSGGVMHHLVVRIHGALKSINSDKTQRAQIDSEFRKELEDRYRSQVDRIEAITGRLLSAWR